MSVNVRLLRQTIAKQGGQRIASRANAAIKLNFEVQKDRFLEAFDADPVTQEIEAGPGASSDFVHTEHGGDLYSLLGFPEGKEPIAALREMLDDGITVDTSKKRITVQDNGRILVEAPVTIPTLDEIYSQTAVNSETKLPWTSRSFVQLIQRGITGFGRYLAGEFMSPDPSLSGGGIEAKKPVRDEDMAPIPYLNKLLADFKRLLAPRK